MTSGRLALQRSATGASCWMPSPPWALLRPWSIRWDRRPKRPKHSHRGATRSGGSSRSCSMTSSPQRRCRRGSIPRICAGLSAYHRSVTEIVEGFGGFVARYMGDGVLVYFGYPQAHEGRRRAGGARRAGVVDAVGRLDVGSVKLQARVGMATGVVSSVGRLSSTMSRTRRPI